METSTGLVTLELGERVVIFITMEEVCVQNIFKETGRYPTRTKMMEPGHGRLTRILRWSVSQRRRRMSGRSTQSIRLGLLADILTSLMHCHLSAEVGSSSMFIFNEQFPILGDYASDSSSSGTAIVFGLISLLLAVLLTVNFVRNFYRSWSTGAKGGSLIMKTLGCAQ